MDINLIQKNVVVDNNGCWIWQKSVNSAGYGQTKIDGTYWLTHRYAYFCFSPNTNKPILRHLCGNRRCCNPTHIVAGDHRENYYDSYEAHLEASARQRSTWIINGVAYNTVRDACFKTGLSSRTLLKHTKNGVFDTEAYRKACIVAAWPPKV